MPNNLSLQPRQKRSLAISDSSFAVLLVLPAFFVLCCVIALPIIKGVYVSFFKYRLAHVNMSLFGFSAGISSNLEWNSFANYLSLFRRGEIWQYLSNTLVFVGLTVGIQLVLGMLIALLLNSKLRGRGVFRSILLIPWTIPSVVVAILWRWMLHQNFGVINYLAFHLGLSATVNVSWQLSYELAMASIVIAAVWRQLPYMMVMLLAGMQSTDASLLEAARIDGANGSQVFFHVTIPSIRPVLISSTWIAIMNNFQMYTIIANMQGNNPATTTLSIAVYQEAFKSYNFGKGAAIGVLWLILLSVITLICNRLNDKYATDYQ